MLSARRTLLPTLAYRLTRPALEASEKPALFTMNILPPLMTVWHHLARKHLGNAVDIVIFDCSGRLDAAEFPGARVQKYLNLYAATKCDEFIRHIARRRRVAWLCDDDMFFLSSKAADIVRRELAVPGTASLSFRPRSWWRFHLDGKDAEASGSYCLALDRSIFWEKERLSLAPADGNRHAMAEGKPRRYDTFDLANERLLQKGYRCAVVAKQERDDCVTGFSGMSGAVMLLSYFRTPEQTIDYYLSPPKKQWTGTVLFGTLYALLAVCTVQECYERLTGKKYPLPSLPSRTALEAIKNQHLQYRGNRKSFDVLEEAEARLKSVL